MTNIPQEYKEEITKLIHGYHWGIITKRWNGQKIVGELLPEKLNAMLDETAEQILSVAMPLIEKRARWEVGEELCIVIGNLMLKDMEAGKLLGSQLNEYMKQHLKSGQSLRESK